jgi:hypothetical protein
MLVADPTHRCTDGGKRWRPQGGGKGGRRRQHAVANCTCTWQICSLQLAVYICSFANCRLEIADWKLQTGNCRFHIVLVCAIAFSPMDHGLRKGQQRTREQAPSPPARPLHVVLHIAFHSDLLHHQYYSSSSSSNSNSNSKQRPTLTISRSTSK